MTTDTIPDAPTRWNTAGIDLHRYPDGTLLSVEQVAAWLTPPGRPRPLAPVTIRRRFATVITEFPKGHYYAEDIRRVIAQLNQRNPVA